MKVYKTNEVDFDELMDAVDAVQPSGFIIVLSENEAKTLNDVGGVVFTHCDNNDNDERNIRALMYELEIELRSLDVIDEDGNILTT